MCRSVQDPSSSLRRTSSLCTSCTRYCLGRSARPSVATSSRSRATRRRSPCSGRLGPAKMGSAHGRSLGAARSVGGYGRARDRLERLVSADERSSGGLAALYVRLGAPAAERREPNVFFFPPTNDRLRSSASTTSSCYRPYLTRPCSRPCPSTHGGRPSTRSSMPTHSFRRAASRSTLTTRSASCRWQTCEWTSCPV